jgi:hypothetical protein
VFNIGIQIFLHIIILFCIFNMIFSLSSEIICKFSNTFEAIKFNAKLPNLFKIAGRDLITSFFVYDNKIL